jgi:anaerobic selenocysteine-containing dehydrogenase
MFRTLTAFVVGVALLALGAAPAAAADEKEKEQTLEGKITCAKCDLGVADKCATVIKVGEKVYYFDKDGDKKYHGKICTTPMDGTVTGTVKKDGDKMVVTVTKLEFKK